MALSLYVHIPFCLRKCRYCDFPSFAGSDPPLAEYLEALLREMELRREEGAGLCADTLYFGGGTPSLLPPPAVEKVVEAAVRLYGLQGGAELTLEVNPGTVSKEKLRGFRAAGINRLSIGVQSFGAGRLEMLGRIHSSEEAVAAVEDARRAGFDNIGIDLIHSLPQETLRDWEGELERAVALSPRHISAYALSVEEGTPFHRLQEEGRLPLPAEEESEAMFRAAVEILSAAGYRHYEISNFALPGSESRHNSRYWRRGNYLGFGAAAHSFLRSPGFGLRWSNPEPLAGYLSPLQRGELPQTERRLLSPEEAMSEFLFLGLRLREGVDEEVFARQFGVSVDSAYPSILPLLRQRLLLREPPRLRLSEQGVLLSNQVFVHFV